MAAQRRHILIVDDSLVFRELWQHLLAEDAEHEYVFAFAASAEDGLRLCRSQQPDCVLVDYQLPRGDGLEFLERLVADHGEMFTAVVMLTAEGDETVAVRALKGGAQDYLVKKDVKSSELRRAVDHAMETVALRRALAAERRQLAERQQELERSNRELEQFAYVASHDLQEPLRMVTGYVELLANRYHGQLDETAQRWIGRAMEGATRMRCLIEDLLELSRIATRGNPFAATDCAAVFDAAVGNLEAAIGESGASVTRGVLPTVQADESQLVRVLQNLLGNAIKFRAAQPPQVVVQAETQSGQYVFSVQDNGIGIERQYFDRIFEIFQRLHTRDEYAGTGIGLAICKKIVARHGGSIWVDSQPGKGSTFYFTISRGTTARGLI